VAIETLGVYRNWAMTFIRDLGGGLIRTTGGRRAGAFFRQRIAIAMQSGNSASVLGTQRHLGPPERDPGGGRGSLAFII